MVSYYFNVSQIIINWFEVIYVYFFIRQFQKKYIYNLQP